MFKTLNMYTSLLITIFVLLSVFNVLASAYRAMAPTILTIDRADSIASGRDGSGSAIPSVTVSSPIFPPNSPKVHLKWVITVAQGDCIMFALRKFAVDYEIACFSGYLALFDGPDPNSPLLMRICGVPQKMPMPVRSTGNQLHIAFYSEDPGSTKQTPHQGFVAVAIALKCPTGKRLIFLLCRYRLNNLESLIHRFYNI